jgi:SET family sugar efflux transporter-like MFS transporter
VSRTRLLTSSAALLWGLQFAFLNPSIGLILVALYAATPVQVGWALAAYNISGFVSTLIVPTRADRRGDYLRPMLWCGVLTVALVTALALVTTLPLAVLALVALGGPAGVGIGLLFAHERHVGTSVAGIMRTRAIFSFAWVAGPPVATLMLGLLGKRSVLWAVAAVAVVTIVVTGLLVRERGTAATQPSPVAGEGSGSVRSALRQPGVLQLVVAFVLLQTMLFAAVSVVTLYVTARLGLDVLWGGIALGLAAGLEIPVLLLLGPLVGRFGAARLLLAGSVAGIVYYAAMAVLVSGPVSLLAAQVLNAVYVATIAGVGLTLFQESIPLPGLASGLFMNTQRLGSIIAGPVLALGSLPGLGYGWVYAAGVPLVVAGLALLALARSRTAAARARGRVAPVT